jgi:ankyrin repeat protein
MFFRTGAKSVTLDGRCLNPAVCQVLSITDLQGVRHRALVCGQHLTALRTRMDSEEVHDEGEPATSVEESSVRSPSELEAEVKRLEAIIEQLEHTSAEKQAQIIRLQRSQTRKSVVIESPPPPPPVVVGGSCGSVNIDEFFKVFDSKTVTDSQLLLYGVNFLVTVYQAVYSKEHDDRHAPVDPASRIAFNYVLEFVRQVNARHVSSDDSEKSPDFGYPINWLLSLFPYTDSVSSKSGHISANAVWMPLHFALALDTSTPGFDSDAYLAHLEVLLTEYGPTAFEEDVSPLSIAVSTARPNLDAVRLILEYRPDAVRKQDEDGSLPLMHACANNVGLETIEFLYEQYPAAVTVTDNFGCGAIHYAAFYGAPKAVGFLLQVEPSCASMVEGNGALPLHDAVQNTRCCGSTEMVELLLSGNPDAARKRDDYGAFPLHMAAKAATLNVVQLLHQAFPKVRTVLVMCASLKQH